MSVTPERSHPAGQCPVCGDRVYPRAKDDRFECVNGCGSFDVGSGGVL